MKKIIYYTLSLTLAVILTSCLKDIKDGELFKGSKDVAVGILLPGALSDLAKDGFEVTLRNADRGFSYVTLTDKDGKADLKAELGTYTLLISKDIEEDGVIKYLRAQSQVILHKDSDPVIKTELEIKASNKGTIILKEVYFHKSKIPGTGKQYGYDQYFSLYNNTDKVQYLDGIGLGFHTESNSNASPKFVKEWIAGSREPRDSVPTWAFGMVFLGDGSEYPMQPGDEVAVALSAINHTAEMTVTPMDLSTDDTWAIYIHNRTTGQKAPASRVKVMKCYCQDGLGTQIVLSQTSPVVVIYRIEGDPAEYVKEKAVVGRKYGNMMFQPPKYNSLPSIMIPKEWVYDGVEFRSSETHVARLCPEISFQPLTIESIAQSGESYIRKVDEAATAAAGGRIVYQDSNNSATDWVKLPKPTRCKN